MNSNNETNIKHDKNNGNDNQTKGKKRTFDLIKEYIHSQPDQIRKLENSSKEMYEIIEEFIHITNNYSSQLEILALKIIPIGNTTEGKLAQAVQGILLFYSENLNILTKELSKNNVKSEINEKIMDEFNEYKTAYFKKINNAILSFEKFKKEISLYQEYLVNEEYNNHMMKGNLKNNDDDIIDSNNKKIENNIDINDENKEVSNPEKEDGKNILKNNNPFSSNGLNNIDNQKEVIESDKSYLSNLNESNEIFKNLKEYLSKEKTNLRKNIFNVCVCLIEGLLKCVKNQKENYDIQNEVIINLTNELQYEERDKNKMKPMTYKLKYLEIYKNYINEKSDLIQIYSGSKDNTRKNSNTHTKSLTLVDSKMSSEGVIRNTISYNNKENKLNQKQIDEKYKLMITKLSRLEILNIFKKIKNTNIMISEYDSNLIEQETNYNKIKEILTLIFIHTENYTESDKDILIKFFEKDKIYIFYFIKVLNDHRTKGEFVISEETLKYLGELFKFINNLILSKNDMELFKFVFILSMTYYHKTKDGEDIYLFSYIKEHPDYKKDKFWDDYLKELIEHDLNNKNIADKDIQQLNREQKEILYNSYFSNFLTAVKAMADFRIDKEFVRNFVEKNKTKYVISQEQIENVCMMYDTFLNENNSLYRSDSLTQQNINKLNNDNININNNEQKNNIDIDGQNGDVNEVNNNIEKQKDEKGENNEEKIDIKKEEENIINNDIQINEDYTNEKDSNISKENLEIKVENNNKSESNENLSE